MRQGPAHPGVTRPSIPPLAWLAVGMWIGSTVAQSIAWWLPTYVTRAQLLCAAVGVASVLLWRRSKGRATHAGLIAAMGVLVGVSAGLLFWDALAARTTVLTESRFGTFECEVIADPVEGAFGYSVAARVTSSPGRGAHVSVMLPEGAALPGCGQRVRVRGTTTATDRESEWAIVAHRKGQACRIKAWKAVVLGDARSPAGLVAPFRRRLLTVVGRCKGEGGALLQGVLLGERSRIRGTRLEDQFRMTGLSHLLAVSGTHISIVSMLAGGALAAVGTPLRRRVLLAIVVAGGYVALTGAPTSSLRAFVMTLTAAFASFGGRRGDTLGGLSAAVVGLLAVSPANAFDIGFALSVCAVAGLVVFAPLANEWAKAASPGWFRKPASALAIPVVAQCTTLPVAIPAFNMISMAAPLANVVALPLASVGLGLGIAAALLTPIWPAAGLVAMRAAASVFGIVCIVARSLSKLPRAAIAVGGSASGWGCAALAVGALVWAVWPHPRGRKSARWVIALFLAYCAVMAIGVQGSGGARLTVFDVGQGDAILLADGDRAVLVDTGPGESEMRSAIARAGIRHLDAVILTHPHADHDGGLGGVADVVSVDRICLPAMTAEEFRGMPQAARTMTGEDPVLLRQGDRMRVGGWELRVLWPPGEGSSACDTNDTSFVIEASYGAFRAILTGDAETAPQEALVRAGLLRDCDVVKVPHHGSAQGISEASLRVWEPELALVSVGTSNDFGHPSGATLALLARHGVRVERTDHSGDLTVRVRENEYELVRQ